MPLIGVISDTHGLLRPKVLEIFKECELIVHAGDVGKPEVLEQLRSVCPVVAVKGNIDRDYLASSLKATELINVDGFNLFVIHDISQLNPESVNSVDIHAVIFGHSHKAAIRNSGELLYFNPGSAGPRRFSLPVTVGLLKISKSSTVIEPEIIELPVE